MWAFAKYVYAVTVFGRSILCEYAPEEPRTLLVDVDADISGLNCLKTAFVVRSVC